MYNHEPRDYICPFCRILHQAKDSPQTIASTDVIFQDANVTAFLGLGRWENNPVDVLIVPNRHIENLYDLPQELVIPLHHLTRGVALALKSVFQCEGISTRQHNEPAGDQDVWHYHVHVTPRFACDRFYENLKVPFPEVERIATAKKLRDYIAKNHTLLFDLPSA
jgi:histidine triad (HIT) family protein